MLASIGLIALAMLIAPPLACRLDQRAGWVLALAPLAAFIHFVTQMPVVAGGGVVTSTLAWVPALGVDLAFRLDGLSLLFALLITGIGTLIVLYAGAYLSEHHHLGRFYAYLLGCMAAMLGLVLATPLALAGAVFYLIHHIVVKANLFFIGGIAARLTGSERLAAMGGLYARAPRLTVLFAIPALSLAGIPPLSGFWAKFVLVKASLDASAWIAAADHLGTPASYIAAVTGTGGQ